MSFSNKKLGMMIRNGRKEKNYTQEQLAEKLDCNISHYGCIERGEANPSLNLFCDIFRTLNLSADEFLYSDKKADEAYQQLHRILSQCTEHEIKILLANAMTLLEYRDEKPE